MESKFVWKAKTVFQNAAAKAERVLTEIKADLVAELSSQGEHRGQLPWIGKTEQEKELEEELRKRILEITKNPEFLRSHEDGKVDVDMQSAMAVLEWDENLRELRFQYVPKVMKEKEFWKRYFAAVKHVKGDLLASNLHPTEAALTSSGSTIETRACEAESPKKDPIEEEAYKKAMTVISIPPSVVIRRLAAAIESGRSFETMSDLAVSGVREKDASQGSEWSTIVSGLKKLSIRDKKAQSRSVETCHSLLCSLFDTDVQYEVNVNVENNKTRLSEELHGAPPQSFIAHLAEVIVGLKSEQTMAVFWLEIVKECRRRWANGELIPRMPVDSNPDLNYCLLLQQIQVINCCIGRRKRRLAALESLNDQQLVDDSDCDLSFRQARLKDGQLVARVCVDCRAENLNLKMLETGEPIYSPITQEGPVLTEDSIKENEELVMRTGSFGAGCSQLFSDMQAFKAANPGCILEDFVRWYSPLDWREEAHKGSEPSLRGSLSTRMRSEGNLWQELWFSARPIPAVSQAPLFDEELAGESTLETLENIAPADFFEQLFTTALCAGFTIAEAGSSTNKETFQRCLKECTDYILSTCHRHMDSTTLEHLCEVYELMENAMHAPPEEQFDQQFDAKIFPEGKEKTELKSESSSVSNQLADLKKFLQRKQGVEDSQGRDGPVSSVVKFFEGKTSLFDRKSKQQQSSPAIEDKKLCSTECGDWTLV